MPAPEISARCRLIGAVYHQFLRLKPRNVHYTSRVRFLPGVAMIFAAIWIVIAPPALAGPVVPQGKIDTLLLSDDDVSSIVGLPLHRVGDVSQSPALAIPLGEHSECRFLIHSDVDMWSGEFTAYRALSQQDQPDQWGFVAFQAAATYPSAGTATQIYRRAFTPAQRACNSVALPIETDPHGQWRIDGLTVDNSGARWTSRHLQDGEDTTWHCANEVRLKSNVMYQDQECQYGNGSPLVAQMANMTASRIPS
jgi:hypothetical protein